MQNNLDLRRSVSRYFVGTIVLLFIDKKKKKHNKRKGQ